MVVHGEGVVSKDRLTFSELVELLLVVSMLNEEDIIRCKSSEQQQLARRRTNGRVVHGLTD